MSLADELLADLEADEDAEENEEVLDNDGITHHGSTAVDISSSGSTPMDQGKGRFLVNKFPDQASGWGINRILLIYPIVRSTSDSNTPIFRS